MCVLQILIVIIIIAVLMYLWNRYEGMEPNIKFLNLEQQFAKLPNENENIGAVATVPVAQNNSNVQGKSCCFVGSQKHSPCYGNLY